MKIAQQEAVNAARIGQIQGVTGATNQSALPVQGTAEPVATPAATVLFSAEAQQIASVKAAVNAAPDVRTDIVNSLKAKIDSGTYHVSGQDIADMMLRRYAADHSVDG